MKKPWLPPAMRVPPKLDPCLRTGPVRPCHALLLNPFYPKDPHASFGKHVLTPSLALTCRSEIPFFTHPARSGTPPETPAKTALRAAV